jgi:hypothetical protein
VLELDRPFEQRDAVLQLVARDRQLAGTLQPVNGSAAQAFGRFGVARPGEIRLLRARRLRVVMREQCRVLVSTAAGPLEPVREACMERGASGLRERPVRNLAGERVPEHILDVTRDRRAAAPPHEVAVLEGAEDGIVDEDAERRLPERAADDRGCLERRLRAGIEQVDARREQSVNRVRDA